MEEKVLDIDEALQRFNGNNVMYVKLLKRFIEINSKLKENIENVVNSGNVEDMFMLFHSLKGGFANLSAKQLYNKSVKLEYLAKNNDLESIKNELESLYCLYDKFITAVNDYDAGNLR
jgi:HPt (histidine-containing phosphotransfer) domain-containing protein